MVAVKLPLVYSGKLNFHSEHTMRTSSVIGGAFAGAIAAITFKVKPACSACKSKFTWNYACIIDGKPVCGKCGEDVVDVFHEGHLVMHSGRCNKKNLDAYRRTVSATQRLIDKAIRVRSYSKNYRGEVPPAKQAAKISTDWFPDKDEAEFELKKIAARKGCDVILEQDFERQPGANPENSRHTIGWFRFFGTI
jgi:hypothetical protein